MPVLPAGTAKITIVQAVSAGSPPFSFLMELNNAAWSVYQTGTHNSQYLWCAAQWSKRTVDLAPAPYNYDTLAHLLYLLRFFYEAEAMQQHAMAVAMARQAKAVATTYEQELEKMMKRTL